MKFIADVHLGKLAKLMRMLGFDVLYKNSFSNQDLMLKALTENRILLTKNNAFQNRKMIECFIKSLIN